MTGWISRMIVLHCDSHASPEQRLDALHSFDERLATRD